MNFASFLTITQGLAKAYLVFVDHNKQHLGAATASVPALGTVLGTLNAAASAAQVL